MRRLIYTALLFAPMVVAQSAPPASNLPPLIDRELLFGNPEIAGAQISPDAKYIAFLKPWHGALNIWVKTTAEPFDAARLMTSESRRPVAAFMWSRDGKYICYVKDNNGDENFNLYVVDPAGKPAEGAPAPASRDLTGLKGVAVQLYAAPKSDPDALYIGINDRDKAWHDLYKVKLSTGEKTLIRQNTERVGGWIFDLKGELRLASRSTESGDQETLRVDKDALVKVYSCSVFESCAPLRFTKDGKKIYFQTNKGADTDLSSLVTLDPESGKIEMVESDPLHRVDFAGAVFSEATDELAMTSYVDERQRNYFKDKSYEADFQWLESKLPGREVTLTSHSADDGLWLVAAYGDTEPGETYLFNRKARTLALQYKNRENVPRESLAAMKPIHYKSSDGLEIPAFLMLPKGLEAKALPLIVMPHGGPWARDVWGYNPIAQFLANRGYAVLMPNYRGSTGYGKKFLNAGNGEWGRRMQDDLTWGVKHLVAEGIADPRRVGIIGASYGGYAVLAGAAFTPELYCAGVDIVGPSNLRTLLESIPPYWESARKLMYARMADPATPEGKAWFKDRSPLFQAERIKTPLLIAQGANDPRVNKAESEQIVVALRERGAPVEYLVAPDEGHGFQRPINNLALFTAAEKFFAKHLDGRCQESGGEVSKRLAEITVDPKSVKLAPAVDAASVASPKLAGDLQPGTNKYETKLHLGATDYTIQTTTTIKDEDGAWTVIDVDETPMGTATDKSILEKGTLAVRKRTMSQNDTIMELNFTPEKVTGTVSANGSVRNISAEMDGPLFAGAAGSMQSIACLPLAEGYTLVYRNFDLQRQTVRLMRLAVTGTENITVPAGTFDAYRVEIASTQGGKDTATVWIAKDTRKVLKMVTGTPAGATVTTQLLP